MCVSNYVRFSTLLLVFTLASAGWGDQSAQQTSGILKNIIQDVARGWEQGDPAPFRKHFLNDPEARYVESGGQNVGLDDLVDRHVVPEGQHLSEFALTLDPVEVHIEGNMAWAIVDVEVSAVVNDGNRRIHNRGYETFLFRNTDSGWKVIHTHSSSRPVKKIKE